METLGDKCVGKPDFSGGGMSEIYRGSEKASHVCETIANSDIRDEYRRSGLGFLAKQIFMGITSLSRQTTECENLFKDINNLIEETEIKDLIGHCIFPDPDKLDKVIAQYKSKSDLRLYGIVVENQVVGIVGYKQLSSDIIEIQHISVNPQYRGGGYGRGLIFELLNTEKPAKITAETDGDAVDFYRRIGFEINSLGEKYPGVERYLCSYLVDDVDEKAIKT